MKRIIIQGVRGSFHDIAARGYFGDTQKLDLVEAYSFPELFQLFEQDSTIDHAVMAIENSIAGSIMRNYSLLKKSNFHITGEILLRIKQNLLALPGTKPDDIKEVHSHPMALEQCKDYLDQYKKWRRVEREDTALCANEIAVGRKREFAAIASELAAEEYGLEVISSGIETNKRNFTRFLILSRDGDRKGTIEREKVSVCFSLKHTTGSLSEVLTLLAKRSCNLTKIQSVPIVGKEFQYFFFVDFILENDVFEEVEKMLRGTVESLQILGHYRKGEYYDN